MTELICAWTSRRVPSVTLALFTDAMHETEQGQHIIMKDAGLVAEVSEAEWSDLTATQQIEVVSEAGEKVGDLVDAIGPWRS